MNMYYMNKQKEGRLFEDRIHSIICKTKSSVLREKHIRAFYSSHISAIDHLLINGDYCIAIQDKHVISSKPSNVDINHFKSCVNDLSIILNRRCIGIYLSLLEPTIHAMRSIEFENKHNNNYFIFINNINAEKLIMDFLHCLYVNKIYVYDDEDTYMLGTELNFIQ